MVPSPFVPFVQPPSRWSARRPSHQSQDFVRKLKKEKMTFEKNNNHKRRRREKPEATRRSAARRRRAAPAPHGRKNAAAAAAAAPSGLGRPHVGPPPGPEHLLEAGAVRELREEPGRARVPFASSCRAPGPSRRRRLELALPFPSPPLPAPLRKLSRPPPRRCARRRRRGPRPAVRMRRRSASIGAATPPSILGYVVRGQRLAGVVVPAWGGGGPQAGGVPGVSLDKHGGLLHTHTKKITVQSKRVRICTIIMYNNYAQ